MFLDFFFLMREKGLRITVHEWETLLQALDRGLDRQSLLNFYFLCRAICVKSESEYDLYDRCFAYFFRDIKPVAKVHDELLEWLKNNKEADFKELMKRQLKTLSREELIKEFEKRLKEQKERHDGGQYWIGTGGSSPFGHGGYHPGGIRVGGGGMMGTASQIASARQFSDLRRDRILDTRSIGMALKKLRVLGRNQAHLELDVDQSIKKTVASGGEIDIVLRHERRNTIKLLLLLDVGGSMTPYTHLCETLFTAVHQSNHFKSFRHFYYHNCPYDYLYESMFENKYIKTKDLLKDVDESWTLLMVSDAAMHPYELTQQGGAIDFFFQNDLCGLDWLKKISKRLPKSAWLNPRPEQHWGIASTQLIRSVFTHMFPLTLKGVEDAISHLNLLNQKAL